MPDEIPVVDAAGRELALSRRVAELEAALEPFASFADVMPLGKYNHVLTSDIDGNEIDMDHCRKARDLLQTRKEG